MVRAFACGGLIRIKRVGFPERGGEFDDLFLGDWGELSFIKNFSDNRLIKLKSHNRFPYEVVGAI